MKLRAGLLLALLVALAPARADRGGYVIRDFHVELDVEPNSELLVRERLEVEFTEPRHGIYRSIPVHYTDPRGYGYSLGFRLLEVGDGGGGRHPAKVTHEGRYIKIRIGSADREVQGRVVYVLRYRVRDAVAHFAEHDELYWNATGTEWQAPIERATAVVRLPGPVDPAALDLSGYTGRSGSREQAVEISRMPDGAISYSTTRPLGPFEGLTVVAAWPPGLVRFPGPVVRVARFLVDNWVLGLPLLALGFLVRQYRRAGRDPAGSGSIVVRYEPPAGVTPGEIGTLVDERADLRDLTATVVDLAVRGYLRIEVVEEKVLFGLVANDRTVFQRLRDKPEEGLAAHERAVLDGLFATGDRVKQEDLKERFYVYVSGIQQALYTRLVQQGLFAADPRSVRGRYAGGGVVAGLLVIGLGIGWSLLRGGVMPFAALVPVLSGAVTAILFFCFAPAMPRRTPRGVELREWALGFEEFVGRVEREKLEADRARNVFESLLPYAMALGVAAAWARRFEGIYAQAAPAWYVGPHPGVGFSTASFERSLSATMASTGETLTSAPRS
ncbi:MAG TPA: DUF2207 domain-containing protein, partial [Candidatus Polarisedimenticolaceae bacterium]|nr:DUF2207 domain-containing protein [Candidatus Polarisedimenticolaceae bacterium]